METEPILKKKPPISNFTDWRKQFDFPNGPTGDHLQITQSEKQFKNAELNTIKLFGGGASESILDT